MAYLRKVLDHLQQHRNRISAHYWTQPAMEVIFQSLFRRELDRWGVPDIYQPIGAAANYGLLYLIARAIGGYPVSSVLELGCGQSTLLIESLRSKLDRSLNVVSVEQDAVWRDEIQGRVDWPILHRPMVEVGFEGRKIRYYSDFRQAAARYDMIIVDGPIASKFADRRNRLGFLGYLDQLSDDFVIIVDDAERAAERKLAREIRARLTRKGIPFSSVAYFGAKVQHVIAGGAFQRAAYG